MPAVYFLLYVDRDQSLSDWLDMSLSEICLIFLYVSVEVMVLCPAGEEILCTPDYVYILLLCLHTTD